MTSIAKHALDGAMEFSIASALGTALERVRERRARRASLRALEAVDTATLRDIGMSRAEITSVCYGDPAGRRRHHQ